MDREAVMTASETLLREDFYHQQYGVLFEAIVELFNEEKPVDVIVLKIFFSVSAIISSTLSLPR